MKPLIQAENITVIRQKKIVLKKVSIAIGEKDFITIIGPNGAGKSMLLKCLMGFYKPDNGVITQKNNLKIGYVPQHMVPESTMPITAKRFLHLRKKSDRLDIEKLAQETNTEHVLNKQLSTLSDGELQRILLARCLLDEPELLVLDEPAQHLDISGQLAFYKLLEKIYSTRKLSILMVSHDLHMVMATSKQVVCLFHYVCCAGEPHIVTKDPEFISLFGHDMANMMAVYHHSHNQQHDGDKHV